MQDDSVRRQQNGKPGSSLQDPSSLPKCVAGLQLHFSSHGLRLQSEETSGFQFPTFKITLLYHVPNKIMYYGNNNISKMWMIKLRMSFSTFVIWTTKIIIVVKNRGGTYEYGF